MRHLGADDLYGVLAVLEEVEGIEGDVAMRQNTLAALQRHFGYDRSNFFLAPPLKSGRWPTDGVGLNLSADVIERYSTETGSRSIFLSSQASTIFRTRGVVTLGELLPVVGRDHRLYAQDFLFPNGIRDQLTVWLPSSAHIHGYISLVSAQRGTFSDRDIDLLGALRPHLSFLLAQKLSLTRMAQASAPLTARERQISTFIADGLTNRQIARQLTITEDTVKKHVSNAMLKLNLRNRTQLALHVR